MDRYLAWFIKWMPDSFVICLSLTIFVALLAYLTTDTPVWSTDPESVSLISAWADSFWNLLTFTMQMVVLLATGSAVASSPPATRVLSAVARLPRTRNQALILTTVGAALMGFLHWGLGIMTGIVLGKEIIAEARRKNIDLHPPVVVAAAFMALLPGSAGLSGAAVLYSATPGYLKDLVPADYADATPETIPLTESVLRWDFVILLAVCMLIAVIFAIAMHPKAGQPVGQLDESVLGDINERGKKKIFVDRSTPAQRANSSRIVMVIFGSVGLFFTVYTLINQGMAALNLNSFNFLFLFLGILLCAPWGPEYYAGLLREGIGGTWGFILQFPFYAGIFGLISLTGLGTVLTQFFTSISTPTTWPVVAFLYSGLLNIAVPSGGSKFVIEAPYVVPTSLEQGVELGLILQAYQMGDGVTNLLIPFFALPYLANFKLKFSEVVGYTVPAVMTMMVVTSVYLLIMA